MTYLALSHSIIDLFSSFFGLSSIDFNSANLLFLSSNTCCVLCLFRPLDLSSSPIFPAGDIISTGEPLAPTPLLELKIYKAFSLLGEKVYSSMSLSMTISS